jgi:hypothetical protein
LADAKIKARTMMLKQWNKCLTWFGNPGYVIVLMMLILVWFSFNTRLNDRNWRYVVQSDGKGYYAYLPAVFIYQDLSFPFVEEYEERYYDPGNFSEFRAGAGDHIVNKYWSGVAVMMSPFFSVGYLFSLLGDYESDGYDYPFQASLAMGAIFWLLFGVYLLHRVFIHEWKISSRLASLSLMLMVFATNLFYYTIYEPSMSHVYSFAAISLWIDSVMRFKSSRALKHLLRMGLSLGLITLIRPTNLVMVFSLPFLLGGFQPFKDFLFTLRNFNFLSVFGLSFMAVVSIQILIFLIQTGRPLVYSYGDEGFRFLHPEIFNLLFSFRKGLFVYTPLTFLSLAGFFFMPRERSLYLFLFLFLVIYLLSSWWMWFYGGSYGMRAAIDYYPFFVILLALAIQKLPKFMIPLSMCCLLYSAVQTYQYTHWILPYDGMNKEKFMTIFMKTGDEYIGKIKAE